MIKSANYRATIAIGSGKEAELFLERCNRIAEKLNLRNVKGEANYSALFRRAVESLEKELGLTP